MHLCCDGRGQAGCAGVNALNSTRRNTQRMARKPTKINILNLPWGSARERGQERRVKTPSSCHKQSSRTEHERQTHGTKLSNWEQNARNKELRQRGWDTRTTAEHLNPGFYCLTLSLIYGRTVKWMNRVRLSDPRFPCKGADTNIISKNLGEPAVLSDLNGKHHSSSLKTPEAVPRPSSVPRPPRSLPAGRGQGRPPTPVPNAESSHLHSPLRG